MSHSWISHQCLWLSGLSSVWRRGQGDELAPHPQGGSQYTIDRSKGLLDISGITRSLGRFTNSPKR